MESVKVKSVTFYQSVMLNSIGYNTVAPGVERKLRGVQVVFCDDKVFVRDKNWEKTSAKDMIVIIGLHNVRHLSIDKKDFRDSKYGKVFDCFDLVESEDDDEVVLSPSSNHIPGTLPEKEDLQAELDAMGVQYDKRWGVHKLMEVKDAQGVAQC